MKPVMHKGRLVAWKDDRGFGFIKPYDGSKDVFLHISALKKASRCPKVGNTIFYELTTQVDGKVSAFNASIEGVGIRLLPTHRANIRGLLKTVIGTIIVAGFFTMESSRSNSSPITSITKPITSNRKPGCTIKGNISISTGKKLYHLPGMEDYKSTRIDPAKGERWFCTESEAIANGWRKAPK
mgnify:CR=1 FL=1